jgi:SAM-dependent methyltransferase
MMTIYEWEMTLARLVMPVLPHLANREIRRLVRESGVARPKILDVGGRKSPYTIGVTADVTVSDIPRASEVQEQLGLGFTDQILRNLQRRRSNIVNVVLEDMCRSAQPSDHFDGVVSVEVIEHVPEDDAFVAQMARVTKPGGWLFLTTPNGDYVKNEPPNYNPDHIRHYARSALAALLEKYFREVKVSYAIRTGKHRARGFQAVRPSRPLQSARSLVGNVVSHIESRSMSNEPRRMAHLVAIARK